MGTNKLRRKEFLVITTWLFKLADGSSTMSLQQAENGVPPSVSKQKKEPTLFENSKIHSRNLADRVVLSCGRLLSAQVAGQ
jgi:hypothetical protein